MGCHQGVTSRDCAKRASARPGKTAFDAGVGVSGAAARRSRGSFQVATSSMVFVLLELYSILPYYTILW